MWEQTYTHTVKWKIYYVFIIIKGNYSSRHQNNHPKDEETKLFTYKG